MLHPQIIQSPGSDLSLGLWDFSAQLHLGVSLAFVLYYFLTGLEISEPWTLRINVQPAPLHREVCGADGPTEGGLRGPSGHMDASGLSAGSLGWSGSSWGTMMAQPTLPGPLDKNRTRASLPWSFSVAWGEADDITWGRSDWEAPFPPRWKVQEV